MATSKPTPSIRDHSQQGQLPIHTNGLYIGVNSLNIYLTYDQAVQAATNILKKAELLKKHEDQVVQVWTKKGSEKLYFGITNAIHKGATEAWES
jgi:hypothetical protein